MCFDPVTVSSTSANPHDRYVAIWIANGQQTRASQLERGTHDAERDDVVVPVEVHGQRHPAIYPRDVERQRDDGEGRRRRDEEGQVCRVRVARRRAGGGLPRVQEHGLFDARAERNGREAEGCLRLPARRARYCVGVRGWLLGRKINNTRGGGRAREARYGRLDAVRRRMPHVVTVQSLVENGETVRPGAPQRSTMRLEESRAVLACAKPPAGRIWCAFGTQYRWGSGGERESLRRE
jgi:hypothetical protein